MKKVFGIKEVDFFTFIKKINEFNETHDSFSTQTHIDTKNNIFYAIIYFESNSQPMPEKADKSSGRENVKGKPPFNETTPDFLSPKQVYFFKSRNLPFPDSYPEAIEIIGQIKNEEQKKKEGYL